MNEAQWIANDDPEALLEFLPGRVSDRKRRLLAVALARRVWNQLADSRSRVAIEVSERFSDRLANDQQRNAAGHAGYDAAVATQTYASQAAYHAGYCDDWEDVRKTCTEVIESLLAIDGGQNQPQQNLCVLLRDIVGNPFRPVTIDPAWLAWNDGTVRNLAQAIYDERELPSGHLDAGRLAILADALEEAGCTSADILSHCRSPGPHVRGCWVVDLLLGKE